MTPALLPVALLTALLVSAYAGPHFIRLAAPTLTRRPRAAVALLAGGAAVWLLAFAATGPLLAWMTTGRSDGGPVGVCRRCLESSNPWAEPLFDLGIPAGYIMAGPALLVVLALVVAALRMHADEVRARRAAALIRSRARPTTVRRHSVLLLPDERPAAFALPRRHGGIVLSTAALALLSDDELDAVLAHEQAHLTQHHHVIAAISHRIARVFRPVPLVSQSAAAIPLYLEIAADNTARELAGTRALAAALLKLIPHGQRLEPADAESLALHAVGPQRIPTLVGADRQVGHRRIRMVGASVQNAALIALTAAITLPWLTALTTGCS